MIEMKKAVKKVSSNIEFYNAENAKTQRERVVEYLKKHKQASSLELAFKLFIGSPRKRISEIRALSGKTGLTIVAEKTKVRKGVYINIYRLARCKKTIKANEKFNFMNI